MAERAQPSRAYAMLVFDMANAAASEAGRSLGIKITPLPAGLRTPALYLALRLLSAKADAIRSVAPELASIDDILASVDLPEKLTADLIHTLRGKL